MAFVITFQEIDRRWIHFGQEPSIDERVNLKVQIGFKERSVDRDRIRILYLSQNFFKCRNVFVLMHSRDLFEVQFRILLSLQTLYLLCHDAEKIEVFAVCLHPRAIPIVE